MYANTQPFSFQLNFWVYVAMGSRILLYVVWGQKFLLLHLKVILVPFKVPIPFPYEIDKTEVPDISSLQYSLPNSIMNHFLFLVVNTRILSVSSPIFLLLSRPLSLFMIPQLHVFLVWVIRTTFLCPVLFTVLLHIQQCTFIFLCLNYSCHEAEAFSELFDCDSQLGRYPAAQIGLR